MGLEHAKVSDLMVTDGRGWDIDIISDLLNARDRALILRIENSPIDQHNRGLMVLDI